MKKIVVLTGAGISAESGIKTFRDADGLWEDHRIEDVATYDAWVRNSDLVMEFYNQRRKQLYEVIPNAAHYALVKLESKFDVYIITQNVDDLHERAGSKNILHLHGELKKARSTVDPNLVYPIEGWELKKGNLCQKGSQLRPHIVWFGEPVPAIIDATSLAQEADILLVIGTSMLVYPAAGLINYVHDRAPKYYIDPKATPMNYVRNLKVLNETAGKAVPSLVEELLNNNL
ncbi:MAG: NAD-dependent deacylase [Bacteroidales bacterium]|nr:NAD-dependent deacylase [Bacteroidales bacterium]MDZ4205180.1 NAD-dependent deacylase [Bacteroidales bacterium]